MDFFVLLIIGHSVIPYPSLKAKVTLGSLLLLPSYLDLTVLVYFLPKLVEDAAADGGAAAADDPGAGEMLLGDGRVHGQHHHKARNQGQVGRLVSAQAENKIVKIL